MKKLNWLFLFLFTFAFVACDDEDEVDIDTAAPTITITAPAMNASMSKTTAIQLRGTIMDNMGLDVVRVNITDPSGTSRAVSDNSINDFLNDDKEANINTNITLDAAARTGQYMIMVEAVDDAGNQSTKSVSFMVTN